MVKQNEVWNNQWQEDLEKSDNRMKLIFRALPQNEGFARVAVAAFMTQLDPLLEDVDDVKTAVSEAVTNCIIHGYETCGEKKDILLEAYFKGRKLHIKVEDCGVGIENIGKAMEPLYTTKPELERSGMGFAFMEAFMDELHVESEPEKGTVVYMNKWIGGK
jgi:stage II sporulation protein AB (anti-sigma F factor)